MSRRTVIFKLASALLFCASQLLSVPQVWAAKSALPFDDISHSYAKDAIVRLSKLHLIDGSGNRRFQPVKTVTRAEFVTMLDRLFGIEPVVAAIPSFSDVSKEDWFYRWVEPSIQIGVVSGTSADRFEPNLGVTREDAAVMLAAALNRTSAGDISSQNAVYRDQKQIGPAAVPAVIQLKNLGLMQGDGTNFRPLAFVSRQEAAVLMDRVLQHKGWSAQLRSQPASKIQMGWQYGQTTAQYEQQILQSNVNTLSPRWFYLDKSGTVQSHVDASLITWAHQHGKKVWAMTGNRSNDSLTHLILADANLRTTTIQSLLEQVRKYEIDGLNIDFENVAPADRDSLTGFITELGRQLHEIHAILSFNVSPDLGTEWTRAFDYAQLGANADYILLMGYDEHWGSGSTAGSVSSLPWLRRALDKLVAAVPAGKVILALPLYTRDWTIGGSGVKSQDWSLGKQTDTVASQHLLPTWNPELAQYVSVYPKDGVTHQLWLEEARSLTAKTALGEQRGVAGYAYWYMGGETPDIWASLRNQMRFREVK